MPRKYDARNYSLGPQPMISIIRDIPVRSAMLNFADTERRAMAWMSMKHRLTGGPHNCVGDHDPDYVPPVSLATCYARPRHG